MYSPIVASKLSKLLPAPGVRAEPITRSSRLRADRARLDAIRESLPPEKLAARTGGYGIMGRFWFMPYIDNVTQETDAMRAAYKTMLKSPYVKSALMTKVLAVASLDWQIQPANPDSPRDKELCEFLRWTIEETPDGMPGIVQAVTLPRLIDGYAVSEKVIDIEERHAKWSGKAALKNVKSRNTDLYMLEIDNFNNVIGVRGVGPNADKCWPISDFIYTRHMPIYDSPGGMSDLRAAYGPYWMEDTVKKLRAMHAEKFVSGFLLGEYADDNQQGTLESALERARSFTWMSVPEGVKVQALNLAQSGESDYKSFLDDCKKDMLVAILGAYLQVLEGQVSDGRGSASVSKSISELYQWHLAVAVQEVFNKQIFPGLVDLNYPGCGYPRLTLGSVSEQELASILANFQVAQSLGLKLSKKQTYARTSIEPPSDPDDELQPVQPAPPMPGGGPAGALPFSESGGVERFAAEGWKGPFQGERGGTYWVSPSGEKSYQEPTAIHGPAESNVATAAIQALRNVGVPGIETAGQLSAALGLPADTSSITVTPVGGEVMVRAKGDGWFVRRDIVKNPATGEPEIDAKVIRVEPHLRGRGTATKILASMVEGAYHAGIRTIRTYATRKDSDDPAEAQIGYAFWPARGYDAPIPDPDRLPPNFAGAKTLLDLYAIKGGAEWWKENGGNVKLAFDTRPGSRSRQVLDAYMRGKAAKHSERFAELPPVDEVALAGPDGKRAAELLGAAKARGTRTLYYLTRRAVRRLLANPDAASSAFLFDPDERQALADSLAATNATATMLGRSRIREIAEQAELVNQGLAEFGENDRFMAFVEPPPPLPPKAAIEYFQRLVPGLQDNPALSDAIKRESFTLAATTDEVLLSKVKDVILEGLQGAGGGPQKIDDILDAAGVGPRRAGYGELVYRTNMMNAYVKGAQEEVATPEMQEMFPVWQYIGIRDGRQGKDHEPHFDRYYPSSSRFEDVRGPRIFNCRCCPAPVSKYEWKRLQASGASVSTFSEFDWGTPDAREEFADVHTFAATWKPYTNPRDGRTGAISSGGRVAYGAAAQKYLGGEAEGGGKGKPAGKAEPTPAKKPPAVRSDVVSAAKSIIQAARENPATNADDLRQMMGSLRELKVAELTELKKQLNLKAAGTKSVLARKIVERAMGNKPLGPPKPEPVGPINLGHKDASHPVAKEIAADAESHAVLRRLHEHAAQHDAATRHQNQLEQQRNDVMRQYYAAGKEKRAAMEPEVLALDKAWRGAAREAIRIRDSAHQTLAEAMKPAKPTTFRERLHEGPAPWDLSTGFMGKEPQKLDDTEESRKAIRSGTDFVKSLLNDGGDLPVAFAKSPDGRAFYNSHHRGVDNVVAIGVGDTGEYGAGTVAHELGHLIETRKPGIRDRARAFLAYRVGDEPPIDMGEQRGELAMKGEMGRKDNFEKVFGERSAYYVGKVYRDGDTEIVSMGIEQLYRDPLGFAKKDPEYCQFILSVLRSPARKA